MFSHVMLGTNNLCESMAFYDRVMPVLGYDRECTGAAFAGYGKKEDMGTGANCLWIGNPFNGEPASPGVRTLLTCTAKELFNPLADQCCPFLLF